MHLSFPIHKVQFGLACFFTQNVCCQVSTPEATKLEATWQSIWHCVAHTLCAHGHRIMAHIPPGRMAETECCTVSICNTAGVEPVLASNLLQWAQTRLSPG